MKATFKGVPGEQHASVHMYGQDFPLNQAVTLNNPMAKRKLLHHPHFEVQEEASDNAEDAQIKREFTGATEAALAEEEAKRLQDEQNAVAASTANQEQQDGRRTDPERAGVSPSAQAAGSRPGGKR